MILKHKPTYFIDLQTEIGLLISGKILLHILLVYLEINLLYSAELHEAEINGLAQDSFLNYFKNILNSGFSLFFLFPLYQIVKVLIISSILHIGFTLYQWQFSFKRTLWIVSICEFILLIPIAYKLFYFAILHPEDYLRTHFKNFSFGALLDFVSMESLEEAMFFVLQAINIWNLLYFILAGYLIKKFQRVGYDDAYKVLFNSYGLSYLAFIFLGYLFLAS